LNHLWKEQDEDGAWGKWLKCKWPPYEIDDHFGVTLAALALGHTPSRYRRTTLAKRAERRLRSYLRTNRPVNPHQKGMMLWLSTKLDDVVDEKAQKLWVDEFSDLQRADGGWRLVDLGQGEWKRPKDDGETLPSDAYATGFTIFVLRQAGVPKDDPGITNGLKWLRKHQRESGRWFVRSPRRDGKHFISHAATQFAVMAFVACSDSAAKK
ncbi:MAG: squalene--hopene cyclase, partial [Planctomycetota bacterium]|nr:squalene--hopene cyclase [Planctomycetota bacterium]